jgi:hypothetical protein
MLICNEVNDCSYLCLKSEAVLTRCPDTTFGPSLLQKIITEPETKAVNIDAMDVDDRPSFASTSPSLRISSINFQIEDFPNVTAGMKAVVSVLLDKGRGDCLERLLKSNVHSLT